MSRRYTGLVVKLAVLVVALATAAQDPVSVGQVVDLGSVRVQPVVFWTAAGPGDGPGQGDGNADPGPKPQGKSGSDVKSGSGPGPEKEQPKSAPTSDMEGGNRSAGQQSEAPRAPIPGTEQKKEGVQSSPEPRAPAAVPTAAPSALRPERTPAPNSSPTSEVANPRAAVPQSVPSAAAVAQLPLSDSRREQQSLSPIKQDRSAPPSAFDRVMENYIVPNQADYMWGTGGAMVATTSEAQKMRGPGAEPYLNAARDARVEANAQRAIALDPRTPEVERMRAVGKMDAAQMVFEQSSKVAKERLGALRLIPAPVRNASVLNPLEKIVTNIAIDHGPASPIGSPMLGTIPVAKALPVAGTVVNVAQGVTDYATGQKSAVRATAETVGAIIGGALGGGAGGVLGLTTGPGAVAAAVGGGALGGYAGGKLAGWALDAVNFATGEHY